MSDFIRPMMHTYFLFFFFLIVCMVGYQFKTRKVYPMDLKSYYLVTNGTSREVRRLLRLHKKLSLLRFEKQFLKRSKLRIMCMELKEMKRKCNFLHRFVSYNKYLIKIVNISFYAMWLTYVSPIWISLSSWNVCPIWKQSISMEI